MTMPEHVLKDLPKVKYWYCNGCGNTFPRKRRNCAACRCPDIRPQLRGYMKQLAFEPLVRPLTVREYVLTKLRDFKLRQRARDARRAKARRKRARGLQP
jgi:hypothetical protein